MKKIVIIYLLLLFTNILIAQDKIEVTKFRTLRSGMVLNFEKPEWSDNGKGILVTYTLKNVVITKFNVYSNKEEQYDIIRFYKGAEDEEHIFWQNIDVINKEGEKYVLRTGFIKKYPHLITLLFLNEDGNGLIYELGPND